MPFDVRSRPPAFWLIIAATSAVLVLIIAMAAMSPTHSAIHPDEAFHFAAYAYYMSHWLPPALTSPDVVPTLSGYGYSYLFELDVMYAFAAHAMSPFAGLFTHPMDAARSFNVMVFACLGGAMFLRPNWAPALAVVLISPQVWYVFSYFNGDAFPLAIGMLLVAMAGQRDGAVAGYIESGKRAPWALALFVALLAALLLSKRNYLPLVPGILLWLAIAHIGISWLSLSSALLGAVLLCLSVFAGDIAAWSGTGIPIGIAVAGCLAAALAACLFVLPAVKRDEKRPVLRRLMIAILAMLAVASPRVIWDIAINGSPGERAATVDQIMEDRAATPFKPSVVATGQGYEGRDIATRGVTLGQMLFQPYQWISLSAKSAFGVYGFMSVFTPDGLYWALMLMSVTLAVVTAIGLLRSRPDVGGKLLVSAVGIATLVVLISVMHSWTFDLQRQGRYLFPLLPLLALMVGAAMPQLPRKPFGLALGAAAALSFYSYAMYALPFAFVQACAVPAVAGG